MAGPVERKLPLRHAFAAQSGWTSNYVVLSSELVDQGRHLGGFWVGISQLPRSHPWTVRRIWRLHQLGLFGPPPAPHRPRHAQEAA